MPKSSVLQFLTDMENQEFNNAVFSSDMVFLKQDLRTHFEAFHVRSGSYIHDVLNDFILQCHQHGFIEYFISRHFKLPKIDKRDTRKVLTMYMLSAGFYLWIISVVVACVVFVIEHIVRYFSRTIKLAAPRRSEVFCEVDEFEMDGDQT